MRRILAIFFFLALAAAMGAGLPCGRWLLAQSGCCMERDSFNAPWRRIPLNYEACRRLNEGRDRDEVDKPRGFVWWNSGCQ